MGSKKLEERKDANRAKWQSFSDEWANSGLSQADFCKQKAIKVGTFSYWRHRLLQKHKTKTQSSFLPVKLIQTDRSKPNDYPVSVEFSAGVRVRFASVDILSLSKFLQQLGIKPC